APALAAADQVWLYTAADLGWDTGGVLAALGERAHGSSDIDTLARDLARAARPGDHLLIMSNGGFGGLHGKLLAELERPAAAWAGCCARCCRGSAARTRMSTATTRTPAGSATAGPRSCRSPPRRNWSCSSSMIPWRAWHRWPHGQSGSPRLRAYSARYLRRT